MIAEQFGLSPSARARLGLPQEKPVSFEDVLGPPLRHKTLARTDPCR
jgi:hypothetical protein